MERRAFVAVTLSVLTAPLAVNAQPATPARIGVLIATLSTGILEALRDGLRELGHIEGQTYTIELRETGGNLERSSELAADLVRSRVDLVLSNTLPAEVAKTVSATIPVVFMWSDDPVAAGLVASFSRPGGNLTGFAIPWEDLNSKWVELLRDAFPRIRRVAYLGVPGTTGFPRQLPRFQAAADALKLDALPLEVRGEADLEAAFAAAARQRAEAVTHQATLLFDTHRPRLVALAARYRLPALYFRRSFVDAGGLMSYGPDLPYLWRRAAVYVDRILKGTRPGDLPVEQTTRYELVVNLRTAKALGVTIPPAVLLRADQVIE